MELPAAVVVLQHLGAEASKLAEFLRDEAALPVRWAREGEPIRVGTVTVCPPRRVLEVFPDWTCALRPLWSVSQDRPVDVLLASLAESFGSSALAAVLTGMGHDGASGARVLRESGGTVLVQDPQEAAYSGMPRAVVDAGGVDLVLPLHEIVR